MFGYVVPHIPCLRVFENEIYRAIYCGLCKEIKKKIGLLSRLNLSYDMVFLSLFSIYYLEEKMEFEKKICKLHPFRKRFFLKSCRSLEKAANIGTILFYNKLKDNVLDCKKFKKIFSFLLLFFLKKSYKKARKNEEEIAKIVDCFLVKQNEIEKEKENSLDFFSHPTADCIGKIFEKFAKTENEKILLYRIGYMLGKYIYLMDALDDILEDIKNKTFNPILMNSKGRKETIKEIDELINFSIAQLAKAFEELKIKKNSDILKNIIYLGLKIKKQTILKKRLEEIKKNGTTL